MRQKYNRFYNACLAALIVCGVASFLLPALVLAQSSTEQKPIFFKLNIGIPGSAVFNSGQPIELTGATLGEYIAAFYAFFVGVAGILATVMIIFGGYKYVVSRGNPSRISDAKDQIVAAITGLVLSLGAYLILLTVNPNLVKFSGFKLESVQRVLQELESGMQSEKGAPAVTWDGRNSPNYDDIFTAYGPDILGPDGRIWLKAIMLVESGGKKDAESAAGACGLMQLLPSTADRFDNCNQLHGCPPDNSITCAELKSSSEESIITAAKYLRSLVITTCPTSAKYKDGSVATCTSETQCINGNYRYVVAAYNGGLGANCSSITCPGKTWWECEANQGFAETRDYVVKVETAKKKVLQFGW